MDWKNKKGTGETCEEVLKIVKGEIIVSRIRVLIVGMGTTLRSSD